MNKGEASVRPLELFMCSVVKRDLQWSIESCWVDPSPLVSTGEKLSDSANLWADCRQWQDYVSYPAAETFLIGIDPFL